MVGRARRALRTKRIGHTGTLDPLATGVLPLVIGRATRLASMMSGADKDYRAAVRMGLATATYDAADLQGAPPPPPAGLDAAAIESALAGFRGTYAQMPPPYSAKKIGGVAAYRLARRNEPVELRAVPVTVTRLTLVSYAAGLAILDITCEAGFYVRTLAHELGARLGCGAHLEALRRTRAGSFPESTATPLATIDEEGAAAATRVIPLERLLPEVPGVELNARGLVRAGHGNALAPDDFAALPAAAGVPPPSGGSPRWRLIDGSGALVGIAESRPGGLLHPVIVLV